MLYHHFYVFVALLLYETQCFRRTFFHKVNCRCSLSNTAKYNKLLAIRSIGDEVSGLSRMPLSKHEVMVLISELRHHTTRESAIERVLSCTSNPLSEVDCKTLLVASVETRSVLLANRLIARFKADQRLSSELLYVGIRTACRRGVSSLAFSLLLEVYNNKLRIDSDSVNVVLQSLTKHGMLDEAWDVLGKMHSLDFGEDVVPDYSTYSSVILCAGRLNNINRMVDALHMLATNELIEAQEDIFVTSLYCCSLIGDFKSALRIFQLYEDLFDETPMRMFSLLLITFLASPDDESAGSISINTSDSSSGHRNSEQLTALDEVITSLCAAELDVTDINLANHLLQFYSKIGDLSLAESYFRKMLKLSVPLSTSALMHFSEAVCRARDAQLASELYDYTTTYRLFPLPKVALLSLSKLSDTMVEEEDIARSLQLLRLVTEHFIDTGRMEELSNTCNLPPLRWFHNLLLALLSSGRHADIPVVFQVLSSALMNGRCSIDGNFPHLLSCVELVSSNVSVPYLVPTLLETTKMFAAVVGSIAIQEHFFDFCATDTGSPLAMKVNASLLCSRTRHFEVQRSKRKSRLQETHVAMDWDEFRAYGAFALVEGWLRTNSRDEACAVLVDTMAAGVIFPSRLIRAFLDFVMEQYSDAYSTFSILFESLAFDDHEHISPAADVSRSTSPPVLLLADVALDSHSTSASLIDASDQFPAVEVQELSKGSGAEDGLGASPEAPDTSYNSIAFHYQNLTVLAATVNSAGGSERRLATEHLVGDYYRKNIRATELDGHPLLVNLYLDALRYEGDWEESVRVLKAANRYIECFPGQNELGRLESTVVAVDMKTRASGTAGTYIGTSVSLLYKALENILTCNRSSAAIELLDEFAAKASDHSVPCKELVRILEIPLRMRPAQPQVTMSLFRSLLIWLFKRNADEVQTEDHKQLYVTEAMDILVDALNRATADRQLYKSCVRILAPLLPSIPSSGIPFSAVAAFVRVCLSAGDVEAAVPLMLRLPVTPRRLVLFVKVAKQLAVGNASLSLASSGLNRACGPRVDLLMSLLVHTESCLHSCPPLIIYSMVACALLGLQRKVLSLLQDLFALSRGKRQADRRLSKAARSELLPPPPPWLLSFILLAVAQDAIQVGHNTRRLLQDWETLGGRKPHSELELNLYLQGVLRGIVFEYRALSEKEQEEVNFSKEKQTQNTTRLPPKYSKLVYLAREIINIVVDNNMGLHPKNKFYSFEGMNTKESQALLRQMQRIPEVLKPTCRTRFITSNRRIGNEIDGKDDTQAVRERMDNNVSECVPKEEEEDEFNDGLTQQEMSQLWENRYYDLLDMTAAEVDGLDLMARVEIRPSEHGLMAVSRSRLKTLRDQYAFEPNKNSSDEAELRQSNDFSGSDGQLMFEAVDKRLAEISDS